MIPTPHVDPISRLVSELSRLPGIGEKTATRLVFFILKQKKEYPKNLADALITISEKIKFCSICQNYTTEESCFFCLDTKREEHIICVVENPQTLRLIEETHVFRGRYHVLHGLIAPLDGVGPQDLKIKELLNRMLSSNVKEIIFALSPTIEGDATLLYLHKLLHPFNLTLSRLAQGISIGTDLEWTDPATLSRAIEERNRI